MRIKNLRSFERSLPMSLLRAREAVMKKFLPALKENGLSSQQWRVIRALENQDGLEMSALSARCYLLMPSLTRIVHNLEGRGYIRRETVASDQRRSALFLCESGRELYKTVSPRSVERYEFITERFGSAKLELLYELLEDLVQKIDEDENDSP